MTDISGRWVGDRVLIVGDYTDKDAVPGFVGADAIYQLAEAQYKDITPDVRKALSKVFRIEYSTTTMGNHTFWNRVLE